MNLQAILETVTDGEEHGWDTEFQWIEKHSPNDLNGFLEDIRQNGIQNPVLIGPDNRLWDGHHRVWAAHKLGLETIPIERITLMSTARHHLAQIISKAKAEGARTERERIATLAESSRQAHDIAECAAYVEGETGRQEAIDYWNTICEEPDVWLRGLAADPEWLNSCLFDAWEEGAFDATISLGHGGHNASNPYTEES